MLPSCILNVQCLLCMIWTTVIKHDRACCFSATASGVAPARPKMLSIVLVVILVSYYLCQVAIIINSDQCCTDMSVVETFQRMYNSCVACESSMQIGSVVYTHNLLSHSGTLEISTILSHSGTFIVPSKILSHSSTLVL